MMNAIDPAIMKDEEICKQAVWMIDGYSSMDVGRGVVAAVKMNTTPYPMQPYMGLMHYALSVELTGFMQGKQSAEQTLINVDTAYIAIAKKKGIL